MHKPEDGDWDTATAEARRLVLTMLEEVRDDESIEAASRPGSDVPPPWARREGGPSLRDLRVRMAGCRDLFREVSSCCTLLLEIRARVTQSLWAAREISCSVYPKVAKPQAELPVAVELALSPQPFRSNFAVGDCTKKINMGALPSSKLTSLPKCQDRFMYSQKPRVRAPCIVQYVTSRGHRP